MKKTFLAVAAVSAVMLCSCDVDVKNPVISVSDSEDITVETGKANELSLLLDVGSVDISYGDSDKAEIHADYKYKGFSQKVVDEIGEHLGCKAETEDGKLTVSVIDTETGKSFTTWKNSNAKTSEVTVDLTIVLPKDFDTYDIDADVGNVVIDSLKGGFNIKCDVGNIEMKSIELTADSDINADVGNISVELTKVGECDVKLNADVGDITIYTGSLKYESKSGDDKPVGAKKEIVIDGKCNMKLECDVGELSFSQEE